MVFVGGGNDKDEIVALTEKLGLSDRVFFSPADPRPQPHPCVVLPCGHVPVPVDL